jgi:hypothetical protein
MSAIVNIMGCDLFVCDSCNEAKTYYEKHVCFTCDSCYCEECHDRMVRTYDQNDTDGPISEDTQLKYCSKCDPDRDETEEDSEFYTMRNKLESIQYEAGELVIRPDNKLLWHKFVEGLVKGELITHCSSSEENDEK